MKSPSVRPVLRPVAATPQILWRTFFAAVIVLLAAGWPAGRADDPTAPAAAGRDVDEKPLAFTRVHVPAGRLSDIPVGTTRYVPMSAREFEEGITRLSAGRPGERGEATEPALSSLADAARYQISLADDGSDGHALIRHRRYGRCRGWISAAPNRNAASDVAGHPRGAFGIHAHDCGPR